MQITDINITLLDPSPLNPRKHYDQPGIEELAASIEEKGIIQPLSVRPKTKGKYEIIVGHRRYFASMLNHKKRKGDIGIETVIPCIIREMADDEALEIMIVENLQRKDVHPMDEAAGFLQLTKIKRMDVREIASRIGKPVSYVAQRMKLNDLVEPLQKCFFENRLSVKDAVTISALTPGDQLAMLRDQRIDKDDHFRLTSYHMQKYTHRLSRAPFPIEDDMLSKDAGACTTCPFNSAFNLLFPDQAQDPVCNNPKCYRKKCDLSYKRDLTNAQNDEEMYIIPSTDSYGFERDRKKIETLSKAISKVLPKAAFKVIEAPEPPDRDEYFYDDEDPEERIEMENQYQSAIADYNTEMALYQSKVASGKHKTAFVLGGNDKGKKVLIDVIESKIPKVSGAVPQTKAENDLKEQIAALKQEEKNYIEKQDGFLRQSIIRICDPNEVIKSFSGKLTQQEIDMLVYFIAHDISHRNQGKYMKALNLKSSALHNITIEQLHVILRYWLSDTISNIHIANYGDRNRQKKGVDFVSVYFPEKVEKVTQDAAVDSRKGISQIREKIARLEAKLKAVKKPTAADSKPSKGKKPIAKKAVTKAKATKGKGLKVLIA